MRTAADSGWHSDRLKYILIGQYILLQRSKDMVCWFVTFSTFGAPNTVGCQSCLWSTEQRKQYMRNTYKHATSSPKQYIPSSNFPACNTRKRSQTRSYGGTLERSNLLVHARKGFSRYQIWPTSHHLRGQVTHLKRSFIPRAPDKLSSLSSLFGSSSSKFRIYIAPWARDHNGHTVHFDMWCCNVLKT